MSHVELSNVRVVPQSRLAGLHKGLDNFYYGVPLRDPEYIHHHRSGRRITNVEKLLGVETDNIQEDLQGNFLYFGAFDYHYGHFISECLGRTWALSRFNQNEILWLPTFHPSQGYEWINELPSWQERILSYLGINSNEILFLTSAAQVSKLTVPESGSWLYTTPKNFFLEFLKFRQGVYFDKSTPKKNYKRNVFIARGPQYSGRILNVEYLYNFVSSCGYEVIYPEELTFDEQMHLYWNAENLIFEAGSAIHTLELFADLEANVAILPRSMAGSTAFRRVLTPRIRKVWNYTGKVVSVGNSSSPRNSDIQVDLGHVTEWLKEGDFV